MAALGRTRKRYVAALFSALTGVLVLAACGSSGSSSSGGGMPKLTVQFSWQLQDQFAGFIVAVQKGFYKDANLDVTYHAGGPNINDVQQLASGQADIADEHLSALFEARDKGIPVQSIGQLESQDGVWIVAKKSSGIKTLADLKGKRVGIYSDSVQDFDPMLLKAGIDPKEVPTFYQGFSMQPFIDGKYPAAQAYSISDMITLADAGITPDQLTIFKPTSYGVGLPQGTLIATQKIIQEQPAALKRFVQATVKGWEWCYQHPAAAVSIVVKAQGAHAETKAYEMQQLMAMKALQWPTGKEPANWGAISTGLYDSVAKILTTGKAVSKAPDVPASIATSVAQQIK
jgi:NitT/TauT family transport system substrate-binding protein